MPDIPNTLLVTVRMLGKFTFFPLHAARLLLIQVGHALHVSTEELACASTCLPAHTMHILQPLAIGMFKSFNARHVISIIISQHPGRVITSLAESDILAAFVAAEA